MKTNLRSMSVDIEPDALLELAKNAGLTQVLVVGFDSNDEFYAGASSLDIAEGVFLIEVAKRKLIDYFQEEES